MAFSEIQIDSPKLYAILKIVILVSAFLVVAFNVLAVNANAESNKFLSGTNATDIKWGLVDDEREHEEESKEWAAENND